MRIRKILIVLLVLISGTSFALDLEFKANYWMGNNSGNIFLDFCPVEGEHETYCLAGKAKLLPHLSLVGEAWDGTIGNLQWGGALPPGASLSFKQKGYWGGLEARLSPLPLVEVAASALWANYQNISSYIEDDYSITFTGISSGLQALGEVAIRPLPPLKISVRAFILPQGTGQYGYIDCEDDSEQYQGTSSLTGYSFEGNWKLSKLTQIVVGYKAWDGKVIIEEWDDLELSFNSNGYYLGAMLKF
jgi:hypothetical protein